MSSNQKKMNQDPALCATGCGFYGNPSQQNLCSICYKKTTAKQEQQAAAAADNTSVTSNKLLEAVKVVVAAAADDSSSKTAEKEKEKEKEKEEEEVKVKVKVVEKKKCGSCKKRVGVLGFDCKCGKVYCASHRLPEMHSCSFDRKTLELQALSKTLYSAADCKADKLHYRLL